jgi:hypothetical protein
MMIVALAAKPITQPCSPPPFAFYLKQQPHPMLVDCKLDTGTNELLLTNIGAPVHNKLLEHNVFSDVTGSLAPV